MIFKYVLNEVSTLKEGNKYFLSVSYIAKDKQN